MRFFVINFFALRRPSCSIPQGFGSHSRGVKRRHDEIARGSSVECMAVLDLAAVFGDSRLPQVARASSWKQGLTSASRSEAGAAGALQISHLQP